MSTKTLKGYYYVLYKTAPGDMTEKRVNAQELSALFDFIGSKKLKERYIGETDARLIAFSGDKLNNVTIPKDDENYRYGIYLKKREAMFPYEGRDNEDDNSIDVIEITIGESSYMFEMTYFMLDKKNGILLYLDNKNVGKINSFTSYLQNYLTVDEDHPKFNLEMEDKLANRITSAPISTPDIQEHLNDFSRVSSLVFKLAGQPGQSFFLGKYSSSDHALESLSGEIITDTESLAGYSIEIRVVPNRKKSLLKETIIQLFNALSGSMPKDSNSKFRIEGKSGINEEFDVLDFLEDKYMMHSTIDYEGRYVPMDRVFNQMTGNFNKRRKELVQRVG